MVPVPPNLADHLEASCVSLARVGNRSNADAIRKTRCAHVFKNNKGPKEVVLNTMISRKDGNHLNKIHVGLGCLSHSHGQSGCYRNKRLHGDIHYETENSSSIFLFSNNNMESE